MVVDARRHDLASNQGFYGSNYRQAPHARVVPDNRGRRKPLGLRFARKQLVTAALSIGIVSSMVLLALNGLHMPSFGKRSLLPEVHEPVHSYDWPYDYLNGTVVPIGTVHSDFSTYDGTEAAIEGNVSAAPGEFDNGCFFIQDHTGGLMVSSTGSGFTFDVDRGDYVRLYGTVTETVQGMHMIENAQSYWVMGTGNTVEAVHMYNSSLVAAADQGRLVKMNGYLTNFVYENTSHTDPDWEKVSCTSTLWMYNRSFTVVTTNVTLSDYEGPAMVVGIVMCDNATYALTPRSSSDIEQGDWPYWTPNVDGYLDEWPSTMLGVDDSDDDTNLAGFELDEFYVSWDADFLHIGAEYRIVESGSVLVFIDSIPGVGATNVSAVSMIAFYPYSSVSRHLEFYDGFAADYVLIRYEDESLQLIRFISNSEAEDATFYMAGVGTGTTDGSDCHIEAAIPWMLVFGLDPYQVPAGATIRIAAVISGPENTNVFDSAPDSTYLNTEWGGWSKLDFFYEFCIDCDLNGYPDDYSSGFEIPEFSMIIIVPMMVAMVLLIRSRRRKA